MKPEKSYLNPHAAAFVPLSKKEEDKPPSQNQQETKQSHLRGEASLDPNIHGTKDLLNCEDMIKKSHAVCDSHDSRSRNPRDVTEKQIADEESEVDLAYLKFKFPGISEQSLADVYSVNWGDLDESIDMLEELQIDPVFLLPDSLGIGDVSDSKCPAEGTSVKLNETTSGEASGSSSSPSKSASCPM